MLSTVRPTSTGRCSAPTGVHRGNSASPAIQKQDGYAVGGSDPDAPPHIIRDQGVTFGLPIMQRVRIQNFSGVDLAKSNVAWWICLVHQTMCLPYKFL